MNMKRFFALLPLLALVCGLVACNDDDDPASKVQIAVTPAEGLTFEAEGGTQTLRIDAQGVNWSVDKSEAWINVTPDAAAGTVEVTVGPWDDTAAREGFVTVTGGRGPVTVPVVQRGVIPTLAVDPVTVEIDSDGGSRTIAVTAEHVVWTVETADAEWIKAEADAENGTIRLAIAENTAAAPRNGSFCVTGEGVEAVTVSVLQAGAVPFWQRSMAYRMGYRGPVKSVSRHIDQVNGPTTDLIAFDDLQFDEKGNLLSFVRGYGDMTVRLTYDAQNRLTQVDAKSSDQEFSFVLEYGDHGKYIPVFEFIEYDLDVAFPVDFRCWMPHLVKDLKVFKIRDKFIADNNLDYRFTASGDRATLDVFYETGDEFWPEYFVMAFEGAYPKTLTSDGAEWSSYEIDAASGKITKFVCYSYYDILLERSLDRCNTVAHSLLGSLDRRFTYNGSGDVVSRVVADDAANSFTASYQYDAVGNWTSMSMTKGGKDSSEERTIVYWE